MGKAEGQMENWHGHVTALTVAPEYRRLGLAGKLMNILEEISDRYGDNVRCILYIQKEIKIFISIIVIIILISHNSLGQFVPFWASCRNWFSSILLVKRWYCLIYTVLQGSHC